MIARVLAKRPTGCRGGRVARARGRACGGAEVVLQDVKVAALFLTRFPVQVEGTITMRDLAQAVYAFPLMGAAVGLLGGLGFTAASLVGLPSLPAALIAILCMILTTGALHEDGLADTADGLGAGSDRERALAIYASMVGALVLARAVDDAELSEEVLQSVLASIAHTDSPS